MDPLGALGNPSTKNAQSASKIMREREAKERLQAEIAMARKECEQYRSESGIEREKVRE